MANNNYANEVAEAVSRLATKEQILGKGLNQPFTDSSSGVRKLMYSIHQEQTLMLLKPQVPFIQTGHENSYYDRSSTIITADSDYAVEAKICKFSRMPQHEYVLILRDIHTNKLKMQLRKSYVHTTETYGYLQNNSTLDSLSVGSTINKGCTLRKSTAQDEYMNSCVGTELLAAYMATDITMEDGMLVSKSAQQKLASALFKKVVVNINDNDLLLNLMGADNNSYKSFPDIGESIENGILCALRQEKSEDMLYSQVVSRLREIMISDTKYTIESGTVIDIDIHCNNPAILESKFTNSQVAWYYNDHIRYITEVVQNVDRLMNIYGWTPSSLDPDLGEFYTICKQELSGVQFLEEKVFSGTQLIFHVLEKNIPSVGDKIATRYGGKGVISAILPDEEMPKLKNGEPLELVINSSTCVNRENVPQWHEISLTHIGKYLVDMYKCGAFDKAQFMQEVIKLVSFASYDEGLEMSSTWNQLDEQEKDMYLNSIIDSGNIVMSIEPISESMTIDELAEIYEAFPYVKQREIYSPIRGSNGQLRFVKARRNAVVGHMYIIRLKQYAEEKHSVTALSSTNLRNENSRSKANKNYKALRQSTPVRFGDMETGDFGHLGMEYVIETLMVHSVSPQARRLVEKIYTEDPYLVDIKLDSKSKNRSAEILNTYLKSIGYRLEFIKRPKKRVKPFVMSPFIPYDDMRFTKTMFRISEHEKFDPLDYMNRVIETEEKLSHKPFTFKPIKVGRDNNK